MTPDERRVVVAVRRALPEHGSGIVRHSHVNIGVRRGEYVVILRDDATGLSVEASSSYGMVNELDDRTLDEWAQTTAERLRIELDAWIAERMN